MTYRATTMFRGVAPEKEERASIWAWPLLTVAFFVFGGIKLVLGLIGLFYKAPK